MKKERTIKGLFEKVVIRIAIADANTTCPCISFQPNLPEAVKKLKKIDLSTKG